MYFLSSTNSGENKKCQKRYLKHITDKGPISKIYKVLLKIKKKGNTIVSTRWKQAGTSNKEISIEINITIICHCIKLAKNLKSGYTQSWQG